MTGSGPAERHRGHAPRGAWQPACERRAQLEDGVDDDGETEWRRDRGTTRLRDEPVEA